MPIFTSLSSLLTPSQITSLTSHFQSQGLPGPALIYIGVVAPLHQPHKILIFFRFLQTGDSCAASLVITYKEDNFTFSGDIPDPISINIYQTNIYEFTMYLKLADGYEMLYWAGRLDLTPPTTATSTKAPTGTCMLWLHQ